MHIRLLIILLISAQCLLGQNTMYDICPLKVGSDLPEATVQDSLGHDISLAELIDSMPTVLVFYRGAWCGYCTQHLAELNDIKGDVAELGYNMYGITIDQPEKLNESNLKAESEMPVYSDSDLDVLQAFGLDWKVSDETHEKYVNSYGIDLGEWSGQDHHNLPVPAVYIIKDNVIQFHYVNPKYSTRLKPETLLAILNTI